MMDAWKDVGGVIGDSVHHVAYIRHVVMCRCERSRVMTSRALMLQLVVWLKHCLKFGVLVIFDSCFVMVEPCD